MPTNKPKSDTKPGSKPLIKQLPDLTDHKTSLFDTSLAHSHSCYAGVCREGKKTDRHRYALRIIQPDRLWPGAGDQLIAPLGQTAHDMLRAHILGDHYPCVGARSAFTNLTYRFGFYKDLGHLSSAIAMGRDLRRFVTEYERLGDFTTFVAAFKYPQSTCEDEFERLLWNHLQMLHEHDIDEWDPHYSPDPESSNFGFSFNGTAFFVVGMHAGASRFSRRLAFPALVFNPESQIRRLQEEEILHHFAETVRHRDTLYQGSTNPSLPESVDTTGGEARVYSGKAHPPGEPWECPFHVREAVLEKRREDGCTTAGGLSPPACQVVL